MKNANKLSIKSKILFLVICEFILLLFALVLLSFLIVFIYYSWLNWVTQGDFSIILVRLSEKGRPSDYHDSLYLFYYFIIPTIIVLPFGFTLALIIKSMRLQHPNYNEYKIDVSKNSEFSSFIDKAKQKLNIKRKVSFSIFLEPNAIVYTKPFFSIFPPYNTTIYIGLPLLLGLEKNEIESIIIHELSHISPFNTDIFIYNMIEVFQRIIHNAEKDTKRYKKLNKLISKICFCLFPIIINKTNQLRHQSEYRSDKYASIFSGSDISISALLKTRKIIDQLDSIFWKDIYKLNIKESEPPSNISERMEKAITHFDPNNSAKSIFTNLELRENNYLLSHPHMHERINAIDNKNKQREVSFSSNNGFEYYFEKEKNSIYTFFNDLYKLDKKDKWNEIYSQSETVKNEIQRLENLETPLSFNNKINLIENKRFIDPDYNIIEEYASLIRNEGDIPILIFNYARYLLQEGESKGIELILKAINTSPFLKLHGYDYLIQYYQYIGDLDKIKEIQIKIDNEFSAITEAEKERNVTPSMDSIIPIQINKNEIQRLKMNFKLQNETFFDAVFIFSKKVSLFPDYPSIWIGYYINPDIENDMYSEEEIDQFYKNLSDSIDITKPYNFLCLNENEELYNSLCENKYDRLL